MAAGAYTQDSHSAARWTSNCTSLLIIAYIVIAGIVGIAVASSNQSQGDFTTSIMSIAPGSGCLAGAANELWTGTAMTLCDGSSGGTAL
jgi:hypothetical protein